MTDLYLIAHKVRGEPAFDIAERMQCPECHGLGCQECDEQGHWWIIPTSGHRAYPWTVHPIWELEGDLGRGYFNAIMEEMPASLPDHYITSAAPRPKLDIRALFRKAIPQTFIRRRV